MFNNEWQHYPPPRDDGLHPHISINHTRHDTTLIVFPMAMVSLGDASFVPDPPVRIVYSRARTGLDRTCP